MANEAVCIVAPKNIVTRICADAVAIPKGTLCKLSGTNIVLAATGTGEAFGGITIEEKTASDGVTTVGCAFGDGVFDILTCGTSPGGTGGTVCCMSGANMIRASVAADLLTGSTVGILEETGAASTVQRVRLKA